MIRVLVVDDSPVVRKALVKGLASDGDIEVSRTATDPFDALTMLGRGSFDVMVLDAEMPRMDGLTFLRKIKQRLDLPVVMCSSLARRSSEFVMASLRDGASEVVPKPHHGYPIQRMLADLRSAIRVAASSRGTVQRAQPTANAQPTARANVQPTARANVQPAARANVQPAARANVQPTARPNVQSAPRSARAVAPGVAGGVSQRRRSLIAVGASTGGIQAFEQVLRGLPANSPGVVVAQHLPANFIHRYADRLNSQFLHRVTVAEHDEVIKPGRVYIAPASHHLEVATHGAQLRTRLVDRGPVNHHRPSVDVLFESVARARPRSSIAVLLTGMGSDGAKGLLALKNAGARTICQDEATSAVFGMPRAAIELGAAQETLPLTGIGQRVLSLVAGK